MEYGTKEWKLAHLKDLEDDMKDDLSSWQGSQKETLDALKWENKMALSYAKSAVQ